MIPVRPDPSPENAVAVKVPLEELNERLVPVFVSLLPVLPLTNTGKQVESELSSSSVISVAGPENEVAVMTPVTLTSPETSSFDVGV